MCPFIQCTFLSFILHLIISPHHPYGPCNPQLLRIQGPSKLLGCMQYYNQKIPVEISWKGQYVCSNYSIHNEFWSNDLKRSTYTSARINSKKITYICTVTVQITKSHTKPISRAENGTEDEVCRKTLALAQFFVAKICINYKAWWDTRLQDHLVPIPKSAHFPHLQWCEERYEE